MLPCYWDGSQSEASALLVGCDGTEVIPLACSGESSFFSFQPKILTLGICKLRETTGILEADNKNREISVACK
jgi:hypothetical protein